MEYLINQLTLGFIFHIGAFIIYEILRQMGIIDWLIESAYTHPNFDGTISVLGESIFGIAISVVAAVIYQWFQTQEFMLYALVFGIIWIVIGATLKQYRNKQ